MNSERGPRNLPPPPRVHPVTRWHRILSIASVLIVLITISTGLILNHSDALDLSKKRWRGAAMRHLYGYGNLEMTASYRTPRGWVTQLGPRVFLDTFEILQREASLVGALAVQDELMVAFTDGLVEFDQDLNIAERYETLDGIEPPIEQMGVYADSPVILTGSGLLRFEASTGEFMAVNTDAEPAWQTSDVLPATLRDELVIAYSGPGVSYERLLLDLHSGRLFGAAGVIIVDVAAVCLLILAVTGVYMYFKFKRNLPPPPPPP